MLNSVSPWILRRISDMVCIFGPSRISHNCGRIYFIKTCKMSFFAWIYVDMMVRYCYSLFLTKADNKYTHRTIQIDLECKYEHSVCKFQFSYSYFFSFFCTQSDFSFLLSACQHPTNKKWNTIQLNSKQYRLMAVCETMKKKITVCNNKKTMQTTVW